MVFCTADLHKKLASKYRFQIRTFYRKFRGMMYFKSKIFILKTFNNIYYDYYQIGF